MTDATSAPDQPGSENRLLKEIVDAACFSLKWGVFGVVLIMLLKAAGGLGLSINKLSFFGAEVEISGQNVAVKTALTQATVESQKNKDRIAELELALETLRGRLAQGGTPEAATDELLVPLAPEIPLAPTAQAVEQGPVTEPVVKLTPVSETGVIWLGSYEASAGGWTDTILANPAALPPPEAMVGQSFQLGGNVNVRAALPRPVDEGYFSGIEVLGVARIGTQASITGTPRLYQRETGPQYWAQVRTSLEPKAR